MSTFGRCVRGEAKGPGSEGPPTFKDTTENANDSAGTAAGDENVRPAAHRSVRSAHCRTEVARQWSSPTAARRIRQYLCPARKPTRPPDRQRNSAKKRPPRPPVPQPTVPWLVLNRSKSRDPDHSGRWATSTRIPTTPNAGVPHSRWRWQGPRHAPTDRQSAVRARRDAMDGNGGGFADADRARRLPPHEHAASPGNRSPRLT